MDRTGAATIKISKNRQNNEYYKKKIRCYEKDIIAPGSLPWLCHRQFQEAATETKEAPKQKFTRATFNATKIINMQSTEIVAGCFAVYDLSPLQ